MDIYTPFLRWYLWIEMTVLILSDQTLKDIPICSLDHIFKSVESYGDDKYYAYEFAFDFEAMLN